jgi:hypothetical protein
MKEVLKSPSSCTSISLIFTFDIRKNEIRELKTMAICSYEIKQNTLKCLFLGHTKSDFCQISVTASNLQIRMIGHNINAAPFTRCQIWSFAVVDGASKESSVEKKETWSSFLLVVKHPFGTIFQV